METIFLRFHFETGMMRMVWRVKHYNSGQNGIMPSWWRKSK